MRHRLVERAEKRKAGGRSHVFDIVEHKTEIDHDGRELEVCWYSARELHFVCKSRTGLSQQCVLHFQQTDGDEI